MILFTGRGTSGSWQIRGVQMAAALGGLAVPMASAEQCRAAEVVVAVKRIPGQLLEALRAGGRPWWWDVVDAYPQPKCADWGRAESLAWLRGEVERLRPSGIIFPNQRMANDFGGGVVLHHHHRPGVAINPLRDRIRVVGYEGAPSYLDGLVDGLRRECHERGAQFVLKPESLADVDVVVAMRGPGHRGYPHRHWKSNVKLANAHGSGTPFIGAPEAGYKETASGAEYWAETAAEFGNAMDWLATREARLAVQQRFLAASLPIDTIAQRYAQALGLAHAR